MLKSTVWIRIEGVVVDKFVDRVYNGWLIMDISDKLDTTLEVCRIMKPSPWYIEWN